MTPQLGLSRYLNIVRELAIADFRLKYHDSAIGYIWSMLNPILMFGVYYFVFTKIFSNKIPNYPLFLLVGIFSYAFFQDCTFSGMRALDAKAGVIKKFDFPRAIIIISSSLTCLISYFINLLMLVVLIGVMKGFSLLALLTPIPIICLIAFSTGVTFLLAALYARFRDMAQIWGVLIIMIFWVSPIIYNVETLPEPISTVVYFNPLTRIFVLLRHFFLYDYFDPRFLAITVAYSFIALLLGFWYFNRQQDRLAELMS